MSMMTTAPISGDPTSLPVTVRLAGAYGVSWIASTGAPYDHITAQFVNLDGVQERVQPSYNAMSVIGRMEQILVYAGTSNREIALQFQFRANEYRDLEDVRRRALWLDALQLPWVDSSGLSNPPPPVLLEIGNHLTMRAIVMSVSITWVAPYVPGTLMPHGADVDVVFASVHEGGYRRPSFGSDRYASSAAAAPAPVSREMTQAEFNAALPPE